MNREELEAKIRAGEIDTVAVVFPDVFGRLSGKRFTGTFFLDAVAKHGTHVCSYLITLSLDQEPWQDFAVANWEKGFGDFHLVPDPERIFLVPWVPGTAVILGDLEYDNHERVAEAPREVLRRLLEQVRGEGFSCQMASELEFFIFEGDERAALQSGYRGLVTSSDHRIDYDILQTGRDEPILRAARNMMPLAGVPVENSKGEWGRGQHEINFTYGEPLLVADRHVFFKHGMKEITRQHGKFATFMAKPHEADAGSSCHIHLSLYRDGQNAFWDDETHGPTPVFRAFLGGLLKYSPDFTLLYAPTINSYKRFQSMSWAPTKLVWAGDNRTVGFRVVSAGQAFRIENRMPGADANPYLAFAGMLAAGLAGLRESLDCGPAYDGNAYADESLRSLPSSLAEAADLFSRSAVAREFLGPDLVDFYTCTARHEIADFGSAVTDWERSRYMEKI
jgi:glutamine synthetase